jgi:vancomycin resistance protein YoaR
MRAWPVAALIVPGILLGGGAAWVSHLSHVPRTVSGLTVGGADVGAASFDGIDQRLASAEQTFLDQPLALSFAGSQVTHTLAELGIAVDQGELRAELERIGHTGDPVADLEAQRKGGGSLSFPIVMDRVKAAALLADLKASVDRQPVEATLDLDNHTVTDSQDGYLLDVYASLDAIQAAVEQGADSVALVGNQTPPRVSKSDLANIDISHVVGYWETAYSTAEVDRDYNLKIAGDKLNGHVLMPNEVFSFNDVVGPRTERQGYHVAPVIDKGELVDGLAGGACQISTTLHAAAFFAGLDIVATTPHSRPSHYITMGLDSTVVYPTTDLKLRNNFDFPVVIHYQVNQGMVRVELLGKDRPYKVILRRKVLEATPFDTNTREDPDIPAGVTVVDQGGVYGYHLKKTRLIYDQKGNLVKEDNWDVKYPPTTEYDRVGVGDPSLPPPPPVPDAIVPTPVPVGDMGDVVRPLPGQP